MDSPPPTLASAQTGERWVIRRRLPDGSATDLIGWLHDISDTRLVVTTGGAEVTISLDTVIAARRAPAARSGPDPLRVPAAELEHVSVPGWVAVSEPLGEWTLRAAEGFTGRANSCHAVGDPGLPTSSAADRIIAFSAAHGIPPWAQVVVGSAEDRALGELGWRPAYVTTDVLVCRLAELLGDSRPDPSVLVTEVLDEDWFEAYGRSRPYEVDPGIVRMILDGGPPRAFASVRDGGRVRGIARGHVNRSWLGLASIWLDESRRRLGWGRRLTFALGHWAARRDARYAYLQVADVNRAASQAYARMGFRHHHSYRVLAGPAPRD